MAIEIEHEPGMSLEEVKKAEREYRKQQLAIAFNISREKLDEWIADIKDFFTKIEEEARKEGKTRFIKTGEDNVRDEI